MENSSTAQSGSGKVLRAMPQAHKVPKVLFRVSNKDRGVFPFKASTYKVHTSTMTTCAWFPVHIIVTYRRGGGTSTSLASVFHRISAGSWSAFPLLSLHSLGALHVPLLHFYSFKLH